MIRPRNGDRNDRGGGGILAAMLEFLCILDPVTAPTCTGDLCISRSEAAHLPILMRTACVFENVPASYPCDVVPTTLDPCGLRR